MFTSFWGMGAYFFIWGWKHTFLGVMDGNRWGMNPLDLHTCFMSIMHDTIYNNMFTTIIS